MASNLGPGVSRVLDPNGRSCVKCGLGGTFRKHRRVCRACELAYRAANAPRYAKLNVEGNRRRKARLHLLLDRLKSNPCLDCGRVFPPYVMDFDHRDPNTKAFEINYLVNKTCCPTSRLEEEIAKCDILCVNCHRLRTWVPPKMKLDKRRQTIVRLKSTPCADCGKSFHYSQMDFDHVRGEKVREVPHCKSVSAILWEASKCDVVCANCHRTRTWFSPKGFTRGQANQMRLE